MKRYDLKILMKKVFKNIDNIIEYYNTKIKIVMMKNILSNY